MQGDSIGDGLTASVLRATPLQPERLITLPDGSKVRFTENAAVLMKRDLSGPIGTRVIGAVARELRENRFMKVVMMSSRVL